MRQREFNKIFKNFKSLKASGRDFSIKGMEYELTLFKGALFLVYIDFDSFYEKYYDRVGIEFSDHPKLVEFLLDYDHLHDIILPESLGVNLDEFISLVTIESKWDELPLLFKEEMAFHLNLLNK